MKESESNTSRRNSKTPLVENNFIELSLINSSDEDIEEEKNNKNNKKHLNEINELFPENLNNKILPKKNSITSIDSQNNDEEEEIERISCNFIPANFFSFCLISYILIFLIIFLCSFNFSYLTLPYILITLIICLLSNVPENNRFYSILYILRIFLFPFVCIYSFGVLIFKTYIFSKIIDNESYDNENKDFILNMGIFYISEERTPFNLMRSILPEIILFIYSLYFSLILLIAECKCFSEQPIYFDNEIKLEEKTPKKIRRRIKVTYLLLLIFAYLNPSFTCFSYIIMFQICLGLLSNDKRGLINKRYCVVKTIIIFVFLLFTVQIGMNNFLQIYYFQKNYLLRNIDINSNNLTCKNAKNIWINLGINCTYNLSFIDLLNNYIGFAFSICSYISIENLIRILSNGTFMTNEDYYKDNEEKKYVDDSDEISWIVRKIKNFFLLIANFIEKRYFISHLCRFAAIIHINYCQNIYSLVVFLWLFLSFLCNDIKSTKCFCIFCLIPVLIISSLCYNLSNFNIFNIEYSEDEIINNNRDIYTFLGLKKLNKYFYFSFISCHIFFLLIITFVSSLENKIETIIFKPLKDYDSEKNLRKTGKTGVLDDIRMLSVDNLIGMNTKSSRKKTKPKLAESNFENKLKDLLQKNINKNIDDKKKDKNKNLKIFNIILKKVLNHINKINLIVVYLICISSINFMHLVLVLIFILNVLSSIIDSKINKRNIEKGINKESKVQYYTTKITLILIQLTFLFEFFIDLYKCFFVYSKSEEEKKHITEIMSFILNYKEGLNDNSCETLLFIIVYFYYFDYQIYLIKNKKTEHKDLEELLNDDKITFYLYFKNNLKYTFFIYDYFIKIMNHIFIWIYTFVFIFFLCYFELNILFSIQLLLFLFSIYFLLQNIQTNINSTKKSHSFHKDIAVTYIFLIFSVANTFIVYLYQFICHDYLFNKIKDTFLLSPKLSYIGLKKYSGNLYYKLLPFFVINFISILFLKEFDSFQKRIEKESAFFKNNYEINNNINKEEDNKEKQDENKNVDYNEQFENCKNDIVNIKLRLFGANVMLIISKIYWIFLFLIISGLFSSYYFSLSILIYIIIFGITFIRMFKEILKKDFNYSINDNISEESSEIIYRIKVNRNHREIAFKFLVAFSFLIFFLYYIYGIFDIAISYCEPKLWIGCDNKDNIIDYDITNNESSTIGFIKGLSFIIGVYYDAKKQGILSVGWVHLFLCFLFCFDVYIQKIENYVNSIKTKIVIELDEKTLQSTWLRQKSLESQVDALLNPNKKIKQNYKEIPMMSGSLREEIGKKIVGNLSEVIKIFNLYKLNTKRKRDKKKLMLSIKYICEEVIILVLVIGGIIKINVWSLIYFIYVFYLIFTKKSIKKFYYFYCFLIIGIIIQILLFVTNIRQSLISEEEDEKIFELIEKHLGIPWIKSNNLLILFFIFGTGIDKKQTDTINIDFLLIVIIYIYLDNFTYNSYNEDISNNRLIMPFIKGNILYDSMIDNPALKNRDINISKKEFGEIKKVVKKNTFIETVNSIRYDDFLIALKKLKIVKVNPKKESVENKKCINSEKQKLLMKLNSKTQQIFNLFEFLEIIIYLSSHNFILIINILISMMIPGVISLIYIILFIVFLFKSNSLIEGKRYYYPHFTKYIRLIMLIDISFQLFAQLFIGEGFIYKFLQIIGVNKLLTFEDNKIIKEDEYFSFLVAKAFTFFFINLQILIYSSYNFIEYYFIYLLTLRVNQHKIARINAFKFNNQRMKKMSKSLLLKEEANNTMNEIQYLLEDWKSMFYKGRKKMSIRRNLTYKSKEVEISNFVNEDEAKKTIKGWIMDKFLIKIYTYIHKYSSPYQNFGNNEMYELEKNIIQGETRPITYIEFLIDFYLDALSPFHLTAQGLSIVESIINGSREEHRLEIENNKKLREKEKEKKLKENENLKKKYQELVENINRIDSFIANLKGENEKNLINEEEEKEGRRSLSFTLKNLIQTKDENINLEEFNENNDNLIETNENDLSNIDKEKLLMYYEKAKKIILEEEEKLERKINKYQEICIREEKHNKNKYLDDETEFDGPKKEILKIDLTDEKFLKFEFLTKKSILFTKYLNNSFIFSCILLDLKSCLTYNFHWFCYLLMIINHMHSPSLISSFYPLTIFLYALLENPRPARTYWIICLYYTFTILFIKLLFTLELLFTLFMDKDTFEEFLKILNNYKIGFKYCSSTIGKEFFSYIIFDILVIISLMIYINILVINGGWDKREQEIETIYSAMERISISNCADINEDEIKDFNKEFLSSDIKSGNISLENISKIVNEKEAGKHRRRGMALMDDFLQNKIKTGKILKEERKESMRSSKIEEEENENNKNKNKEMKKGYFERLFPKNRNEKPGREYYPIYAGAMIVILGYILLFFNYMVKDESYGALSLEVQQFNGLMVIYFIIHVIILICDRAILLFQNQKNVRYKYYLYNKMDFNNLQAIIDFRKKTKEDKNAYFKQNLFIVEDELIEKYPKKKRWANHSLIIPIQHFSELRNLYYISYKQIECFNKPLFCKYLLYIFIVIFVHIIAFVYFPMKGNVNLGNELFCIEEEKCNDFQTNISLILFYIFYLFYLVPSALQIKNGFNDMKKKSLLKRSPSDINNLLVTIFQKIPFLNEIKNILDWTLTSTSLDLSQWIQFESIYDIIFSTYSGDRDEDNIIGQKIDKVRKVKNGGVLSFILISALIYPLFIFSSINPNNIINSVNDAKLKVDLCFKYQDKEGKNYTLFENNRPETIAEISDEVLNEFNYKKSVKTRNFPQEQIQIIKFYETSDKNWDLVLPHIQTIINELNISNPENKINSIDLLIKTTFTRPLPAEAQTVTDEITANLYNISQTDKNASLKAFNLSNGLTNCLNTYINFYEIYTPSRKLSSSTYPLKIEDKNYFEKLGIQLGFQGCDNSTGKPNFLQSYFTLRSFKSNDTKKNNETLSFHIFSETISPTTSSYSVYAFYTAVILVFGEYVRDFCSGQPEKVALNEMPDPKKMVDLCEGITIARNSHDFRMEKKLYFILIELLREPTFLKEITKSSVERFEEREEHAKFITTDEMDD